jgi:hypothetical protein
MGAAETKNETIEIHNFQKNYHYDLSLTKPTRQFSNMTKASRWMKKSLQKQIFGTLELHIYIHNEQMHKNLFLMNPATKKHISVNCKTCFPPTLCIAKATPNH